MDIVQLGPEDTTRFLALRQIMFDAEAMSFRGAGADGLGSLIFGRGIPGTRDVG